MVKPTLAVAMLLVLSAGAGRAGAQVQDVQLASADVPVATPASVVDGAQAAAAPVEATSGPTIAAASLSPRLDARQALEMNAMRRPARGSGVGLMILGGAALITGAIIGDTPGTIIMVGGAIVGLYGLYVYLDRPTGMDQRSDRIGLGYSLQIN